jgi:ADP-dependent NAD(P)H-hydrate dehydratase / NAD(P)H-hydrate epimerase
MDAPEPPKAAESPPEPKEPEIPPASILGEAPRPVPSKAEPTNVEPSAPAPAPGQPASGQPAPDKPAPDRRRALAIRIAAVAVPLVLLVGVLFWQQIFVIAYIRHRANGLGVSVSFDDFEMGRSTLTLKGARARLDGVDGVTISAARVKLALRGSRVTRVEASDVSVSIEGSATDRVMELAAWSGENAATYRLPGTASPIKLAWRTEEGKAPWLTAAGGSFKSDGKSAHFHANSSNVGGVPLARVDAGFTVSGSVVSVELGKTASEEAPITARITATPKPPRVDVTLKPVKLASLGEALGLSLPAPGATARGHAELLLRRRGDAESITGTAELTLDGYVPPHPREMSGVLAGKRTSLTTKLGVAANRSKITLSDVVARAGKLTLKGSGTIARARDHATLAMELKGPVACSDLTRSVARNTFGPFGELLGDAASGAVRGSVAVTVTVDADSRDLKAAKVRHKAAAGCGLKLPF